VLWSMQSYAADWSSATRIVDRWSGLLTILS